MADLNAEGAKAVAAEFGGLGVGCDVGKEDEINALVKAAEDHYGPIDVMFNNAGINSGREILNTPLQVWEDQWNVNVMAHVYAVRAVLPGMIERGSGYLIHTASMAGILMSNGNLPYTVSKHAVVGLGRVPVGRAPQRGHPRVVPGPPGGAHADAGRHQQALRQQRRRPSERAGGCG